jgi:hypothetical protein
MSSHAPTHEMDNETKDNLSEQVEHIKRDGQPASNGLIMPASLAALDDAQYHALGRKATRKMDLVIMPILVIMYILNYLDRQNIASARLASFQLDLSLTDVQYQTVSQNTLPWKFQ